MALTLRDCTFFGSGISESFALNELEAVLTKEKLLEKHSGPARREFEDGWESYRRKLRALGDQGGALRVRHHVLDPLAERLGYGPPLAAAPVRTREDEEDGGFLYATPDGAKLRAWAVDLGTDLDAPNQRGRAYRFSPARVAERVLLAAGERVGLLTDGEELRLVLVDPARPGSHVAVALGRSGGWRGMAAVPDSYRLVRALASPAGIAKIGAITEAARLAQTRVTKSLRDQARRAVEGFVQALLDDPANAPVIAEWRDREALARTLWREGLVVVYRLLFILKLEASADPARAFSFASTTLWRNTYSPNVALAPVVKDVMEGGAETGSFLGDSLRATFRLFSEGLASSELKVSPLGGMLFGAESAPLLSRFAWTEQGVAALLDSLLWTRERGQDARARVHYGSLDVEDLGRVYEALLELEPGIADRPMCRLRRAKLEVVVDAGKGEPYRAASRPAADNAEDDDADEDSGGDEAPRRGKAKTTWVEDITKGRFFLRVGLGRKATGSYYTPGPFVRFLVQETLAPQVAERSPGSDPKPGELLKLKVLDPAMGSGHFLVEACRFLGEKLYEATRLCDGLAADAERAAAASKDAAERERLTGRARELRQRVEALPDPNDELVAYLPSRAAEGGESGLSQSRALAICRRLVAVHSLYGVDKNPLAVELAKVSLWLESYAEGLPLTFLDHRLLCGDSLTGPFLADLLRYPVSGRPVSSLFTQSFVEHLRRAHSEVLVRVRELEESVGKDVADLEVKRTAKQTLDATIAPFIVVAKTWSGGATLGEAGASDDAYETLLGAVAEQRAPLDVVEGGPVLRRMLEAGTDALAYDLVFPEVFFSSGERGFSAIIGNPPWEKLKNEKKAFAGAFDLSILDSDRKSEWSPLADRVIASSPEAQRAWAAASVAAAAPKQVAERFERTVYGDDWSRGAGDKDTYMFFASRAVHMLTQKGRLGLMLGGGLAKNPAATASRRELMLDNQLIQFRHFHNEHKLFADIPGILEFCLSVTRRGPWLDGAQAVWATNLRDFGDVERHDGTNVRLVSREDLDNAMVLARDDVDSGAASLADMLDVLGLELGTDLHRTQDESSFLDLKLVLPDANDGRQPAVTQRLWDSGFAGIRNGRSVGQHTDMPEQRAARWDTRVSLVVDVRSGRAAGTAEAARYFRLALRETCGSPKTNERSLVAALVPPGNVGIHKLFMERAPHRRPNASALVAAGVLNSFAADALIRPQVQAGISKTLLQATRAPLLQEQSRRFIAHGALRLAANHVGFEPLWREQVGAAWREAGVRGEWPVLGGDDARWAVRAAIDAVVADAYGFDHSEYEGALKTFRHRGYPGAPKRCLEAYEELRHDGLAAFCERRDPYFDVPLAASLASPVFDLPVSASRTWESR